MGIVPSNLAPDISRETAALVFTHNDSISAQHNQYYHKKLIDAVIDNEGRVHLLVDEISDWSGRTWSYIQYDKNGNLNFTREIYNAKYRTLSRDQLVARILVNSDLTVLLFYPDSEFYMCWVKLDNEANVIEKHEPRWWRGDAKFEVCSAGQDSFHMISWPLLFWKQIIKREDPELGEYYNIIQPVLTPELYYTNNYSLREEKVRLAPQCVGTPTPQMIRISNDKVFCCSNEQHHGRTWLIDSRGHCSSIEVFAKENLEQLCFSRVVLDTVLSRAGITIPPFKDMTGLSFFSDTTIGVSVFWEGVLYMLRYDTTGKLVQKGKGAGRIVNPDQMGSHDASAFITSYHEPGRTGASLDKTIVYWGFNHVGDFFINIY